LLALALLAVRGRVKRWPCLPIRQLFTAPRICRRLHLL